MKESPTVEQLKGALKNLKNYELWMLYSLANILAVDYKGTGVIHNALLESFLVHARILIEFFFKDEEYKDTVRASHYIESGNSWKNIRPQKTKLIDETEKNAHKYLAHITYTRLKDKKEWPFIEITNEIDSVMKVFMENLPEEFTLEINNEQKPS